MQHVLMTADAVGGVWTYALDLIRALGERGLHVTLAVMGPPPSAAQLDDARELPNVAVVHAPFRLEWMDDPWHDVKCAGEWLLDLERTIQPDVIHLNGYAHAALPWQAPVVVVAHSCVLSWWSAVHGDEPPAEWDHYADFVSRGLAAADLVVAPTAAMVSSLVYHYGPLQRIAVIPNGRSAPPADVDAASRPPHFIFSSGRLWDRAKNLEALSACASAVDWPIYAAGGTTGPNGQTVTLPGVTCLGQLSPRAVASWMRDAAIYALPARYEPFGLSVLEAAQLRCALVLGDIDSLRETWGDAALYVDPGQPHALASALRACTGDPQLRNEMASRAHTRARELTSERMAEAYWTAYRQLTTAMAA
jgi:glycogen synthase